MVCPGLLASANNFAPCGPMYLLLFIPERETGHSWILYSWTVCVGAISV